LYQNSYFEKDEYNFNNSLVHEVFHSLQKSHTKFYKEFMNTVGWKKEGRGYIYEERYYSTFEMKNEPEELIRNLLSDNFPSDYSKLGPEEMFAECGAAFNFLGKKSRGHYDATKYNKVKNFVRSDAYNFLRNFFDSEK